MAGNLFTVSTPSGGVSIASDGNPHTILQFLAPSNIGVKIMSVEIGFRGTVTTDAPIQVRILRQTTAGTGGTSVTPSKANVSQNAIQTTALRGVFSAEPTASDVLWITYCHPQWSTGKALPLSEEFMAIGGGRVGVDCLIASGAANVADATMYLEE